jgi:DNA-binding NarL/FixJ family response regulator
VGSVGSSPKSISILVADENRMACQLLASSLERKSNFKVIDTAVNIQEALHSLKRERADVVVMSVNLKDGPLSGLDLLRDVRVSFPRTRSIVLVNLSDRELVVEAFRNGARGIFSRSQSFKMLCKCIECVNRGQIWANTDQIQFILEALGPQGSARVVNAKGEEVLSKREKEVVACVAEGLNNRQIAQQLHLSEHTVKNYLLRICDKVGSSGRIELMLYALTHHGLSDPGDESDSSAAKIVPN